MENDAKTTLEQYAESVYSGGRKSDDFVHPRSKEIHEGPAPKSEENWIKRHWRDVLRFLGSASMVVLAVGMVLLLVHVYEARLAGKPVGVATAVEQVSEQLSKVEVVKKELAWFEDEFVAGADVPVFSPKEVEPPAWQVRQSLALAKVEANLTVSLARIASQEKLILEVIRNFYKSGNKGMLCLTWKNRDECFRNSREARANLQLR